jgi:DNA-binding response OmpR family regulator
MSANRLARPGPSSGILVVDDEPRIQSMISRALIQVGYTTVCASDGADAVRLASTGEYGLVILDLVMPDMDGRAVLAGLLRAHPEQPVLMLSCVDDATTKAACLDLGADDYLTKPFVLEELLARVGSSCAAFPATRSSDPVSCASTWGGCRPIPGRARSR